MQGIILNDKFFFAPRSDNEKINSEAKLTDISRIDSSYSSEIDGKIFIDYTAPCFEIAGAIHPDKNGGRLTRLDASMLDRFKTELVNGEEIVDKFANYTTGITVRFCTSANKITLKGLFTDTYWTKNTAKKASAGIDVYVGSGTDKLYANVRMQFIFADNLNTEVALGEGIKEVLICLPKGMKLESLSIGFDKSDKVGLPLARDHAPIVFYGSDMTQGMGAMRPGTAYTNLVCRMLNADCINQGYVGGAHGERIMADYIASMDMSAFVMEFDTGATLDELKANHYNFYKTVRDAHPDIPIVIMSKPIFSSDAFKASRERAAVIKETFDKAIEAGDKRVYFLDGSKMFPMNEMLDIYTADIKTPNDLGMYHLGMCVYDILSSAFTPDSEKSGTDRLPGLLDVIDFTPKASDERVEDAIYTKVSDVDPEYISSRKDGKTFLKYSAPQFEIGGINDPADNSGEFYRLDYSNMEAYKNEIYDQALPNHEAYAMSGGTIRFRTNAREIVLKATMQKTLTFYYNASPHASQGFDLYVGTGTDRVLYRTEGHLIADPKEIEETLALPGGYVEVMIILPSGAGIKSLDIGFDESSEIAEPTKRTMGTVCFYGSSVTHGGSSSRPGTSYSNLVCRMLDADNKNLGFSNTGRGEPIMAEYIAKQKLDVFVMELHVNSSIEEARRNHYNFYKTVRDAHPDIPIIIISNPYFDEQPSSDMATRLQILKDTYNKAVAEGDKNVYYIDPSEYFPYQEFADLCAPDKLHPNDMGYYYMAKTIYNKIVEILNK